MRSTVTILHPLSPSDSIRSPPHGAWPQTLVTPKGLLFLIARYGRFGNRAAVMHPDKTPTMSTTPSA